MIGVLSSYQINYESAEGPLVNEPQDPCFFQQEHKIQLMVYTYKNIEFVINQPELWCEACGEGVIDGKDSNAAMPLILAEKARIDGY